MLTVLVATFNGAPTLHRTLDAFCALGSPAGGWRLIVVDNGSTDATPEILDSYRDRLPLTCLTEARPGKNVALNTGLEAVDGDIVVFTDDDVLPHRRWLEHLRTAADEQGSFAIFGGPILAEWESPPESWVLDWVPLDLTFSVTIPREDGPMDPWDVFGPNMTVRAEVFHRGFRFDENIGPRGRDYAMGSETEFLIRLADRGFKAWHVRPACVRHLIRRHQMEPAWILERAYRFGRGRYRLRGSTDARALTRVLGAPPWVVREFLATAVRVVRSRYQGDRRGAFKARWRLRYLQGYMREGHRLSWRATKDR
jgi:glycosyltransferase involved in cell wall biosynthesis